MGASPPVHTLCGCPCPAATSPLAALLSCQTAPPEGTGPSLRAGGLSSKHWKISPLLSLLLNFNFVVTECPCVPACECAGGSAVPEAWSTWSLEGQGDQSGGTSIGGQPPSPQPGARDCRLTSCGPALCPSSSLPPLHPFSMNFKQENHFSPSLLLSLPCGGEGVLAGAEDRAPEPGAGSPGSPTQLVAAELTVPSP